MVLLNRGFTFTMGINRSRKDGWIFDQMERFLSRGEGRVLLNKDGVAASLFYDNKMHAVITNAWKIETVNDGVESNIEEECESKSEDNDIDMSKSNNKSVEEVNIVQWEQEEHPGTEWVITNVLKYKWQGV